MSDSEPNAKQFDDATGWSAADGPQLPGNSARSADARSKNRLLVEALERGESVTIRGKDWSQFVALSELVFPGRREWHCEFANGKVTIRDITNNG